jgi:hypothetical protein
MMTSRPVVALLGAAPGERQALARALSERLAKAGTGARFIVDLAAGEPPALTLLLASDAQPGDSGLREQLACAGIPFSVLYGDAAARLQGAWRLLVPLLGLPGPPPEPVGRLWNWSCDKCSDPVCEHRLFQDLLARRSAAAGTGPAR